MAKFHFVEDYENYVASLLAKHPIDEAMSLAVGGDYLAMGSIQRDVVLWAGLEPGMSFVDFGCGSGRLAVSLARALPINYHGIDIVRSLLDYAASKCPPSYRFSLNHSLSLPVADGAADFISAFSVFTHLLPSEIYIYLEDMHRALRPGGTVVFSFMEVADPEHWGPFMSEVAVRRGGRRADQHPDRAPIHPAHVHGARLHRGAFRRFVGHTLEDGGAWAIDRRVTPAPLTAAPGCWACRW
jgi:SAM-dependent methyltransferase